MKITPPPGGLFVLLTLFLNVSCGPSAEDKARIRQVVTAYKAASLANAENSDALRKDLQHAVDLVPDGKARNEILSCQNLLDIYLIKLQTQRTVLETNLMQIGHGEHSTAKDFEIAKAKATKEAPLSDYAPIVECAEGTVPSFAK